MEPSSNNKKKVVISFSEFRRATFFIMVHSSHSSKRRRLDQAASTLTKPFKSPLRANPQTHENPKNGAPKAVSRIKDEVDIQNDITVQSRLHSNQASTEVGHGRDLTSSSNNDSEAVKDTSLLGYTWGSSTRLSSSSLASDPTLSALQKQQRNLQSRLSTLRSELDVVQQASRIEASSKDQELQSLIEKWKAVSQEAAEELFAAAREKVLRMGGVEVWREQMKKRTNWYEEEDSGGFKPSEGRKDEDEDGLDELEKGRAEVSDHLDLENYAVDGRKKKRGRLGGEELDDKTEDERDDEDNVWPVIFHSILITLFSTGLRISHGLVTNIHYFPSRSLLA
jgi:Swi5-dependent recombination DNA repair protein 1